MTRRFTLSTRIYQPEPAAAAFRLGALVAALSAVGAVTVHTAKAPASLADKADVADRVSPARIFRHKVLRGKDEYLRGYLQYMSFDLPLVWHLLRDDTPDVFVCEPPPTTGVMTRLVSTIKRRPYVYYAADIWSDAAEGAGVNPVVVSALRLVERWVMSGASGVLAVNDSVAERVEALGGKATVVRNGVDTQVFCPDGPMSDIDHPYFLYAGTMSEWQGCEIFVRAFAKVADSLPHHRIYFVGQGSAIGDIQRAIDETGLGERVIILPPVSQEDAAAYQRGAQAALVSIKPGIGYDMAFPTKAMAAWACGTPVIYSGPGVARELIDSHALGLATDDSVDQIAAAMMKVATIDRGPIAQWAAKNVSFTEVARRAADVIVKVSAR